MITTIITSSEIEKRISIDEFVKGSSSDVKDYSLRIASGGVYSAYVIKLLQGEPLALGFAGGLGGRYIKNYLDKHRIKSSFLYKDEEIKSRFIIDDGHSQTILNDENVDYGENDFKNFKHKISINMDKTSLYTINGNLSNDNEAALIESVIDFLGEKNRRAIFAMEGGSIDHLLRKHPIAVIARFDDFSVLADIDELAVKLEILRKYISKYKMHIIVAVDGDDIYAISKNKIVSAKICLAGQSNTKENVSEKGAKNTAKNESKNKSKIDINALCGALAISIKRKYEFEKTAKLLMQVAASFDADKFPTVITRSGIDKAKSRVRLVEIYSGNDYNLDDSSTGE